MSIAMARDLSKDCQGRSNSGRPERSFNSRINSFAGVCDDVATQPESMLGDILHKSHDFGPTTVPRGLSRFQLWPSTTPKLKSYEAFEASMECKLSAHCAAWGARLGCRSVN